MADDLFPRIARSKTYSVWRGGGTKMSFRRLSHLAALLLASMGVANATLELTFSTPGSTAVIVSGGGEFLKLTGSIGGWTMNLDVTEGLDTDLLQSLDFKVTNLSSSGVNPLIIALSEDGRKADGEYIGAIGGANDLGMSSYFAAYSGQKLGSTDNLIGSPELFGSGLYRGNFSGLGAGNAMTLEAILTPTAMPTGADFDFELIAVPEPASVVLFGGALLLLSIELRRRRLRPRF